MWVRISCKGSVGGESRRPESCFRTTTSAQGETINLFEFSYRCHDCSCSLALVSGPHGPGIRQPSHRASRFDVDDWNGETSGANPLSSSVRGPSCRGRWFCFWQIWRRWAMTVLHSKSFLCRINLYFPDMGGVTSNDVACDIYNIVDMFFHRSTQRKGSCLLPLAASYVGLLMTVVTPRESVTSSKHHSDGPVSTHNSILTVFYCAEQSSDINLAVCSRIYGPLWRHCPGAQSWSRCCGTPRSFLAVDDQKIILTWW